MMFRWISGIALAATLGAAAPAEAQVRVRGGSAELERVHDARVELERARIQVGHSRAAQQRETLRITQARQEVETALESRAARLPFAPLEGWAPQDPADSVWRSARAALNRGEFRDAADAFRRISERFSRSVYAADSYYWEAFALSRLNGVADLQRARQQLQRMTERFPNARHVADAEVLAVRIDGQLARLGDAGAAARVAQTAQGAARPPAPPASPVAAAPPVRAMPPAAAPPPPPPPPAARSIGGQNQAARSAVAVELAARARAERMDQRASVPAHCPDDVDIRVTALGALLRVDPAGAGALLRDVLARRDECSAPLRRQAVFLASQNDVADMEDVLLDAIRNDPDGEVRQSAVFFLSRSQTERSLNALADVLRTSTDRRTQESALFALAQHRSPRAAETLRGFATRSDIPTEARLNAVMALGAVDAPGQSEFLRDLYGRVSDRPTREALLMALARRRGEGNEAWLMAIATRDGEDIELRKQALFMAGQHASVPARDLIALYDRTSDRDLRHYLIFVLSRRNEPEVVDRMLEIARSDADADSRRQALQWLSQSHAADPRVARLLRELVGG